MRWLVAGLVTAGLFVAPASGVVAQSCNLLGGDADGDGICDDGSGSGILGDLPCSCQPPAPPACVESCDDNCTFAANPDQLDVGRVGDPDVPDGIGDACQCLDVSDDGRGNVLDMTFLTRALAPVPPPLPAPDKCPGPGPGSCDTPDLSALRFALAALAPAPPNACLASGACTADVQCPGGTGCDLGEARCEKFLGQACVEASQCLSNACCSDACRNLTTDVVNCGACGVTCTNPHGTTACGGGVCAPSCQAGWGSCDANPVNGCERSLTTLSDCGACNVSCNLPNAVESCSTGTCQFSSCNTGYANCDGSQINGCETQNWGFSNTYPGEALGSYAADTASGFLCPSVPCTFVLSRTGTRERWFNVDALENSACLAYVELRFDLDVPPGVNYNLGVVGGCQCDPVDCRSEETGADDSVRVWCADDPLASDSFTAIANVVYDSGSSCVPWTLTVSRGAC